MTSSLCLKGTLNVRWLWILPLRKIPKVFSSSHSCWYIALLMKNNRKPLYNGDHWPKGEFVHSTEFLQHLPSDAHNDTPTCIHTHTWISSPRRYRPINTLGPPSPVSPLAYNPHPLRIFPLAGGRPKIAHGWLTESQGCTIPVRCTTELSDMKCCIKRNIQWNNIARCYLVK